MHVRLSLLVFAAACTPRHQVAFPEPPRLDDEDAEDGRFEGTLVAAPVTRTFDGDDTEFLAFNGTVPGPQLRVQRGDAVEIHFQNDLPTDSDWTSGIHWHGIEGYNAADGTPTTQQGVVSGASFDYAFVASRPGVFWYHPHIRGVQALFAGLYAPLIVEDPDEATLIDRGVLPSDDRVVVLSDTWASMGRITSAEIDDPMEIMNGTEGRSLMVNGELDPELQVVAGSAVRLRLINASITRFWRLSVPGRTLFRVGGEGGLLDAVRVEGGTIDGERLDASGVSLGPVEVDLGYPRGQIVLAPGDRADVVLVTDGEPGEEWPLLWEDVPRGRHDMWIEGDQMLMGDAEDDGTRPSVQIARFHLIEGDATGYTLAEGDPLLAAVGRSVGSIDDTTAIAWQGDDATSLDETMGSERDVDGNWVMTYAFGINDVSWMPDHHAGPEQAVAASAKHASLGDTLRWEVRNNSRMSHPYHLHGFSFQPTELVRWPDPEDADADGSSVRTPWTHDEFEDTAIIPPYASLIFRARLEDPSGDGAAAGRWMQHCHILQHGENGMMSELVVTP